MPATIRFCDIPLNLERKHLKPFLLFFVLRVLKTGFSDENSIPKIQLVRKPLVLPPTWKTKINSNFRNLNLFVIENLALVLTELFQPDDQFLIREQFGKTTLTDMARGKVKRTKPASSAADMGQSTAICKLHFIGCIFRQTLYQLSGNLTSKIQLQLYV